MTRTGACAAEVLIVRQGECVVDIFDDACELVASPLLGVGDLIMITDAGHACRMLKDTVLLEIKRGPYVGICEKVMLPAVPAPPCNTS